MQDDANTSGTCDESSRQDDATAQANLLPDELISFADDVQASKASDEEINSKYVKGDIRIVTESARYSLSGILAMLQETVPIDGAVNGEREFRYKLDPEYQRRHRWTTERKSRLIESFLMNVPVPPIFLYERDLARFEVMDGRQRLTALRDFYDDKFALTGLQYWTDLHGRKCSELPVKVRDGIDRRYISSIILLKETAASDEQEAMLKKMVFERLNSGGVKLSSQETRNAVYDGPLNRLCISLSENAAFRRMWGIVPAAQATDESEDEDTSPQDEATKKGTELFETMKDVELVLRFFAYRQIGSFKGGLNKITSFLDRFLMQGNRFPESLLTTYRQMFESTIEFLHVVLDQEAFTLIGKSKEPTKIIYDPMMYIASSSSVSAEYTRLMAQKDVLRESLGEMYRNHTDIFKGRRTNFSDLKERNRLMAEAFDGAISKLQ